MLEPTSLLGFLLSIWKLIRNPVMSWCTHRKFLPTQWRVLGIAIKIQKWLPKARDTLAMEDDELAYVLLYDAGVLYLLIKKTGLPVPVLQFPHESHLRALGYAISYLSFFNEMVESKVFKKDTLEESKQDLSNFCSRLRINQMFKKLREINTKNP